MTPEEPDHFKRNFVILLVCLISGSALVIIILQVYAFDPIDKKIKELDAEDKAESKAVEIMTCQQLHDGLLHDTIKWSENIQRATERYVAGCEGRPGW